MKIWSIISKPFNPIKRLIKYVLRPLKRAVFMVNNSLKLRWLQWNSYVIKRYKRSITKAMPPKLPPKMPTSMTEYELNCTENHFRTTFFFGSFYHKTMRYGHLMSNASDFGFYDEQKSILKKSFENQKSSYLNIDQEWLCPNFHDYSKAAKAREEEEFRRYLDRTQGEYDKWKNNNK